MLKRSAAAKLAGSIALLIAFHAGSVFAQAVGPAVTDFVTVQPIDVCAANGTNCAIMNNLGAGQNTIAAGPDVQIGFASNGINITRQILNLAGLDVVFQPAVQYLAPVSGLQNLQVTQTQTVPTSVFDSTALKTLTQQDGLSMGNLPGAPLSSNPTTLNMLFVNSLVPDPSTPGTLFGLSWIGNNGIAISQSTFGSVGRGGQTVNARADVIAHEIAHNLGLDHTTFGNVGVNGMSPASDLMTAGGTRNLPNVSVPTPPSQNNAVWLNQVVPAGTVDQLNPQQAAQITDPTLDHFVNPIPLVDTTITDPVSHSPGLPLNNSVAFNPNNLASGIGRQGESLLSFTFALSSDFFFNTDSFSVTGETEGLIGRPSFSHCVGDFECSQLTISFIGGSAFTNMDVFNYAINVCAPGEEGACFAPSLNDLAGSTYTYRFSDGFSTTSDLVAQIVSDGDPLIADSQHPDLSIPTALDLSLFTPLFSTPCVVTTPNGACPALVLADGDPAEETRVPEPSSLFLSVLPFGFIVVLVELGRRRPRIGPPMAPL
ncbi:MAG: hypothetical protein JO166_07270 [Deltaproteobacteria bacterium]|nr:hypothetical protein [Deltaproteobacteria bacterium]